MVPASGFEERTIGWYVCLFFHVPPVNVRVGLVSPSQTIRLITIKKTKLSLLCPTLTCFVYAPLCGFTDAVNGPLGMAFPMDGRGPALQDATGGTFS